MRRVVLTVLLLVGGVFAVDALGDMTQTRGDRVPADSRSEITFEVDENGYKHDVDYGASNLVAACAGRTNSRILDDVAVVGGSEGTYRFTVQPALGPENTRKLVGCIEDLTIDHLQGDVVSVDRTGGGDDDDWDEDD